MENFTKVYYFIDSSVDFSKILSNNLFTTAGIFDGGMAVAVAAPRCVICLTHYYRYYREAKDLLLLLPFRPVKYLAPIQSKNERSERPRCYGTTRTLSVSLSGEFEFLAKPKLQDLAFLIWCGK